MSHGDHVRMAHQYTLAADETPSEGVYTVVAVMENCSPLDLRPLAEVVDPDAVDVLLTGETEVERVSFEYAGYDVTVTPTTVRVRTADAG